MSKLTHEEIARALQMREDGEKWEEIGRRIAYERGRRVPYQVNGIKKAIRRREREMAAARE